MKKSSPKKAPKVPNPNPSGNYMKEAGERGTKGKIMGKKKLSK